MRRALVVVVMLVAGLALAPGVAGAQGCPAANPSYFDACGPEFAVPAWGDAGGWTEPSKYSTIQLADINGDGKDELFARNDQGVEIYWFDTSVGQWRPQVDVNGTPQVLTDFASPAPGDTPATDWTKPEYYSTIQAANLDGQPGEEVYARFADGVHAYRYFAPAGGTNINGGSWQRIGGSAGFSDAVGAGDPGIYLTIHSGVVRDGSTYIFGRRHPTADNAGALGLAVLQGGNWQLSTAVNPPGLAPSPAWDDTVCGRPACYLDVQGAEVTTAPADPATGFETDLQGVGQVLSRTSAGVGAWTPDSIGRWDAIGGAPDHPFTAVGPGFDIRTPGPFTDVSGAPDCPFSSNGASGPGSGDCLGTSPSYYETLGTANIDGEPGAELLARAGDGLRVKRYNGHGYDSLATLQALAGAGGSIPPGVWGSIRTGDINGDGRDEVLALDNSGLEAWSYQPASNAWVQLPGSLGLTGDWLTNPAEYSTIQVGDVNGDGRADVVARGPFGIRTWFYCGGGASQVPGCASPQSGWARYLPEGYPAFSRPGEQAAFAALDALALAKGAITSGHLRDVWTGVNPPDTTTLAGLQANLAGPVVGNCSNETNLAPPTYASCAPPSSEFSVADWTAVVNEMESEAYSAEQVVDQFKDLDAIRRGEFESESGALPAIGNDLQIAGAAGNSASFNLQSFFAGASGVAASIAGVVPGVGAEASAALWVASELISMLPSASETATSTFQTTYSGLLDKLATAQDEMSDALSAEQQQVLGDQGLLGLVGQLRARGTWTVDIKGMIGASREAFVLQTYQALLPTIYNRYVVTACTQGNPVICKGLPSGPDVIGGGPNSTSATWIGPPSSAPCQGGYGTISCNYSANPGLIPDSVANIVWGAVGDGCTNKPGDKTQVWHFGCSLGVPVATSVGADSPGWTFTTESGNPVVTGVGSARGAVRAVPGVVRASAARIGSRTRGVRPGLSARAARDQLGPLRFSGRLFLSRGLRLRRTRVVVERTLFEHGRSEELAQSGAGRRLRPFALSPARAGLFTSAGRGRPSVRLSLRRGDSRGGARLQLRLARVRIRDIRTLCTVLPASVSRDGRRLELETRLRLSDGNASQRITLRQRWRCARDRNGEFTGIAPITPRQLAARPGLAVRMSTPRMHASGHRATVLVTVINHRRRRPSRVVSSLWHLLITGTAGDQPRTIRLKELRARHSRTVRVTVRVPALARRHPCVQIAVDADSARGASTQRCVRIVRRTPQVTG